MNIIVCIKQVPEKPEVGWDPDTGTLKREGVPGILNPNDKNALEAALRLREKHGGAITALSMGPPQAEEALREALSMGVDGAVVLSDRAFAGADTWATAYALSLAAAKTGPYDLILCGKESADGMTGHIGPQLAEFLDLPQLTYATNIEIHDHLVTITQKLEDGFRILESPLPALVTVERSANEPRIPPMDQVIKAYRKEVIQWGSKDLGGDEALFGLKGSTTQNRRVYVRVIETGDVRFLKGEAVETAKELVQILKQNDLI
ncbi:MAG: electron transfer flavoprotein subunit beta/FixA family protein [Deltaproteobacteria bacterium]|nr:electron transfer flavoprotein subunit beta/FixA family protein [Deltaproteobacteria bacterium]